MLKIENQGTQCTFKIGDFVAYPSELSDVPVDLLDMFINYYIDGYATIWLNEEMGRQFTFVITPFYEYVIEKDVELILHEYEFDIEDLAKELISDIENNFNECRMFFEYNVDAMIKHGDKIKRKIKRLKRLIDKSNEE